jgi:hypothetical protein
VEASKGSHNNLVLTYIGRVTRIDPVKRYRNKKSEERRKKNQDGKREGHAGECAADVFGRTQNTSPIFQSIRVISASIEGIYI